MTGRFRKQYRELDEREKSIVEGIKANAETLETMIDLVPDGREKALAMTKLEEAVMWAVKAVT